MRDEDREALRRIQEHWQRSLDGLWYGPRFIWGHPPSPSYAWLRDLPCSETVH